MQLNLMYITTLKSNLMKSTMMAYMLRLRFLPVVICLMFVGVSELSAQNFKSEQEAMQSVKMHIEELQQDMSQSSDALTADQQPLITYRYMSVFVSKLQELNSVSEAMAEMEEEFPVNKQPAQRSDKVTQAYNELMELVTE